MNKNSTLIKNCMCFLLSSIACAKGKSAKPVHTKVVLDSTEKTSKKRKNKDKVNKKEAPESKNKKSSENNKLTEKNKTNNKKKGASLKKLNSPNNKIDIRKKNTKIAPIVKKVQLKKEDLPPEKAALGPTPSIPLDETEIRSTQAEASNTEESESMLNPDLEDALNDDTLNDEPYAEKPAEYLTPLIKEKQSMEIIKKSVKPVKIKKIPTVSQKTVIKEMNKKPKEGEKNMGNIVDSMLDEGEKLLKDMKQKFSIVSPFYKRQVSKTFNDKKYRITFSRVVKTGLYGKRTLYIYDKQSKYSMKAWQSFYLAWIGGPINYKVKDEYGHTIKVKNTQPIERSVMFGIYMVGIVSSLFYFNVIDRRHLPTILRLCYTIDPSF